MNGSVTVYIDDSTSSRWVIEELRRRNIPYVPNLETNTIYVCPAIVAPSGIYEGRLEIELGFFEGLEVEPENMNGNSTRRRAV